MAAAGEGMGATVAVLDIGKTNIKLSAVTALGRITETLSTANPSRPGPPWRHHDLAALGPWVMTGLAELAARHPIERLITTAHGSGGVLVMADPDAGGDGTALPMIDYEQPLPAGIAEAYAPMAGDFFDRGSAVMMLATHQARQLYWMEQAFPERVAAARWYLGLAQYWSWWLSGTAVNEVTLLGAQSHLWNVPARRHAPIVAARGWERLMPPMAPAFADLGPIRPALAHRFGIDREIRIHAGLHDSSANAYRYRAAGLGDAMVVSTGTWIVALAGGVDLSRLDEAGGMTCNADIFGAPVGGALTMGGREFRAVAGTDGAAAPTDPAIIAALVARETFALPTFGDNDGQFPGSAGKGRYLGAPPASDAERQALAVLYTALLTVTCIDRLDARRMVVLDGSFLKDPAYAALVAALRPGSETLYDPEAYGVAAGAALVAGHETRTGTAPLSLRKPAAIEIPGLAAYAERWRAEAVITP